MEPILNTGIEHHPARAGPLAIGTDNEFKPVRLAIFKSNLDRVVCLHKALNRVPKDVSRWIPARPSGVVKEATQIASHDFELGAEALPPSARRVGRKPGPPLAIAINPLHALLGSCLSTKGILESHFLQDLDAKTTQVELEPNGSQIRESLHNSYRIALFSKLEGESVAGDTAAANEHS